MSKNSSYSIKNPKWDKWVQVNCTCLFLLFTCLLNGQNLVPNGNFEDTICCPDDHIGTQLECTGVWFDANAPAGTADFMHSCSFGSQHIPEFLGESIWDAQSQNGVAGLFNFADGVDFSEYLEVKLIDSLRCGKVYQLSIDLKATYPYYASDAVDILFTKDTLKQVTWFFDNKYPQVSNPSGHIIADSVHWFTLIDTFKAQGGERFMTIGSFRHSVDTYWSQGSVPGEGQSYIVVDNIKLVEYVPETPISELPFNVFPNPNNGNFTVTYTLDSLVDHKLNFYNSLGQIIYSADLNPRLHSMQVDFSHLSSGVYIYNLRSGGRKSNRGKLVITK